jgi:peptide/nickel transport system permease protein
VSTVELAPPAAAAGGRARRRTRAFGRQVLTGLATLVAISVITFAATNIKPAIDVARNALGRFADPHALAIYARDHDLDKPVYVRYVSWLEHYAIGDWGISPVTNAPVKPFVTNRLWHTGILAALAFLFAVPLGILAGAYAARHPGSRRDGAVMVGSVLLASLPEFVIGIVLLLVLGVDLKWLPADSTGLSFGNFWQGAEAYVLPTMTLVLAMIPYIARMARSSFQEAFRAPYVQAAVLRGLPRRSVIWRHALPNASVALVNVVAQNLIYALGGVVVVETVFGLPGVGYALVQAVGSGDIPTVQAIALVTGLAFVLVNLAADALVVVLNPKLRGRA